MKRSSVSRHWVGKTATSVALGLCLAGGAATALAAGDPWTAVGSTGVVDDADAVEVSLSGGVASIRPTAPPVATVVLRYNITSTADLNDKGVNKVLSARFLDNGPDARIQIRVISYNLTTGVSQLVMPVLDSDTLPPSAGYRQHVIGDGCWKSSFDFSANGYYIEVQMSRTTAAGAAGISLLRVSDHDIC